MAEEWRTQMIEEDSRKARAKERNEHVQRMKRANRAHDELQAKFRGLRARALEAKARLELGETEQALAALIDALEAHPEE